MSSKIPAAVLRSNPVTLMSFWSVMALLLAPAFGRRKALT